MSRGVGQITERKEIPALVRFERRAVEDPQASAKADRSVSRDVDYALITPPYSKDLVEMKVTRWLEMLDDDVRNERLPPEWRDKYRDLYKRWKQGEELPLDGTPIKGWGVLSAAQQKNLIAIDILTVEMLANVNDEGMRRIGMGAQDLKNKATAWLSQLHDKGPLTMQVAALQREVEQKDATIATMTRQIENLRRDLRIAQMAPVPQLQSSQDQITADDLGLV